MLPVAIWVLVSSQAPLVSPTASEEPVRRSPLVAPEGSTPPPPSESSAPRLERGTTLDPGFHLERRGDGLIAGGAVMVSVGYLPFLAIGILSARAWAAGLVNAVPLVGPGLGLFFPAPSSGTSLPSLNASVFAFQVAAAVISTLLQGGGALLALRGIQTPSERVADAPRAKPTSWLLVPGAGGAPLGLTLMLCADPRS